MRRLLPFLLLVGFLMTAPAVAQEAPTPFQLPPPELAALVDAPPPPQVILNPDRSWMVLADRPALPGLVELAQPELGLAGLRINPRLTGPSRATTFSGLSLRPVDPEGTTRRVTGLPEDARIRNLAWSPDGRHLAFTVDLDEEIAFFVTDVETAQARRLTDRAANDVVGRPFDWTARGELVLRVVPADRGEAPRAPLVPVGPTIQENVGQPAPARTFQNLLQNPHDEALFEYYLDAELLLVDLDGRVTDLGIRGLVTSFNPAPDGRHLHVVQTHRPFSYLVPLGRFPQRHTVHDLAERGRLVATVAEIPLAENVPQGFGSVPTGPRSISWRADAPATLVWVEALDGGDARRPAEERDRVLALEAPFTGQPREVARTAMRFGGLQWSDAGFALLYESEWQTRRQRVHLIDPDDPSAAPRLLFDLLTEDRYNDPGSPVTRRNAAGFSVIVTADGGRTVFLTGNGDSEEGRRPFLRRMDLETGETVELFRSSSPYFEVPIDLLDDAGRRLLTRRESPTEPANFFLRDLEAGTIAALTDFPHPYPHLADVHREVLTYERADGVTLTATLYLPPGYDPERDGPLPTLLWAYPREFRTADAASQRTDSPYQFTSISYWGPVAFVTRGYAVLDNAAMPILGEGDQEPNDTFVEQLIMNAEAAIAAGVRRGVVDPERVGIGGHSYGAFMTANLLAHSDLFRAGIARSGAFNRTLTPFGFQAEQRTLWEAPEVYLRMSPFMYADRISAPILLIHGDADDNSGTFPMQSERFYAALKGHGATARLVMLPHESHGYRARESVMHMLWEQDRWLEQYVKNAPPRVAEAPAEAAAEAGD